MNGGISFPWNAAALATALLLVAARLAAVTSDFNVPMVTGADATITLTVPGGRQSAQNFLPMAVRIANRSAAERSWRLELGAGAGFGLRTGTVWGAHEFTVPGNSTRDFFIATPVARTGYGGAMTAGRVTGPETKPGQFILPLAMGWGHPFASIAVEPTLHEAVARMFPDESGSPYGPARSPHGSSPAMRRRAYPAGLVGTLDPTDWPADWRLWSPLTVMMLRESRWNELDDARRHALLDWVALGGRLALVPESDTYELHRTPHGAGEVVTLSRSMPHLPRISERDLAETELFETSDSHSILSLARQDFWGFPASEWQITRKGSWLTGFILVFGILIGPVNFLYFAPPGRRHRLFVTVPLLSLAATAVLGMAIFVSDGFGGEGTRRTLVALLPEENQAVIFQAQISRTGLLGRREFALPGDVILDRIGADQQADPGGDLWREGDRAFGDWFVSRNTQQHFLRRIRPTRERVELVGTGPAGEPVVQSAVGSSLHNFTYIDEASRYWTAAEVPPGVRVTLQPAGGSVPPALSALVPYVWPSGNFYALGGTESTDLIATLSSIHWRDDVVLYTGPLVRKAPSAPASPSQP